MWWEFKPVGLPEVLRGTRHERRQRRELVFLLWGKKAQSKVPATIAPHNTRIILGLYYWFYSFRKMFAQAGFIDESVHCVLHAAHPSPMSARRGFFGCKHFSKACASSFLPLRSSSAAQPVIITKAAEARRQTNTW